MRGQRRHGRSGRAVTAALIEGAADPEALAQPAEGRSRAELGELREALTARLLCSIPGVGPRAAEVIVAEIGDGMSRFPAAGRSASWAGLCPGQREPAGERGSGKTRTGSKWLRGALIEAAWPAVRTEDAYLSERLGQVTCRQGRNRQGREKAALAVAHEILAAVWWLLSTGAPYEDPGVETLRKHSVEQTRRRAVRQLEAVGCTVTLESPKAA
ncbi:MAG: transposase [Egibacteraceae bacterium]